MSKYEEEISFICNECDRCFNKPITLQKTLGLDTPPYFEFEACPYCGSADFKVDLDDNLDNERDI